MKMRSALARLFVGMAGLLVAQPKKGQHNINYSARNYVFPHGIPIPRRTMNQRQRRKRARQLR